MQANKEEYGKADVQSGPSFFCGARNCMEPSCRPRPRGLISKFCWHVGVSFWVSGLFFSFVWLSKLSVQIASTDLTYNTLWTGECTIKYEEIRRVNFKIGHKSWREALKPLTRLEIEAEKERRSCLVVINLKVFSQKDRQEIMKLVDLKQK